jgi:hypothetical protein
VHADEFAPTPLPVAVNANPDGCDENGGATSVDIDRVAIAASVLVDRFDVQGVVPDSEYAAVLVVRIVRVVSSTSVTSMVC